MTVGVALSTRNNSIIRRDYVKEFLRGRGIASMVSDLINIRMTKPSNRYHFVLGKLLGITRKYKAAAAVSEKNPHRIVIDITVVITYRSNNFCSCVAYFDNSARFSLCQTKTLFVTGIKKAFKIL